MGEMAVLEVADVVVGGLVQQVLLEGVQTREALPCEQHRRIIPILQIHTHQIILRHKAIFAGFLGLFYHAQIGTRVQRDATWRLRRHNKGRDDRQMGKD